MIYNYLIEIEKEDIVIYAGIILFVTLVIMRFNPSFLVIFGIICGILIVYILNDKNNTEQADYVKRIMNILKSPTLKPHKNLYLYKDALIVEFLDFYSDYEKHNPVVYHSFAKLLNNILKLQDDIEKGSLNYHYDHDAIISYKYKAMNTYHSFIYSIPHTQASLAKYHQGKEKLKVLLDDHLDHINHIILKKQQEQGVDTDTKFYYKNHPKPSDPSWHSTFDFNVG
jgi:hypothetical protein